MELKKCKILVVGVIVTILSCMTLWSGKANGQERKYPVKPIDVIIHFAAGGPTDVWTRIVVNDLSGELGASLSIQYKPGAGGMIGASYVAAQKPDGYTLLSGSFSSLVSAPFLEKESAPYDVFKDFTPIAACVVAPCMLLSHTSSNLTSLDAVVKFAKEKPGALNCSTAGVGTTAHIILDVLKMYGVDITPVPAKGGGPAVTSLLGKHVDLASVMYNAAVPHIKSGALRILAATDKMAQEPGVPTFREKGFPEADGLGSLQGFLGPSNLPKPIQDQLTNSIRKVIEMPSIKKALEGAGFTVVYLGPDELKKKMADDYKSIDKIAKAAGLGKYSK
jgi:tripartite-type tricarboxylate transporter receptor subunit TctC